MDAASETPGELRRAVTSPQGVTAAAIDVLVDAGGMPALLRKAISKAVARSRELGQ
jgi:pyrroline-5-carboxylate reductase